VYKASDLCNSSREREVLLGCTSLMMRSRRPYRLFASNNVFAATAHLERARSGLSENTNKQKHIQWCKKASVNHKNCGARAPKWGRKQKKLPRVSPRVLSPAARLSDCSLIELQLCFQCEYAKS
jgi:hypothetical protein